MKRLARPEGRARTQTSFLRLEALEDRTVPTTFVVDPTPGVGNFTTIQEAVSAAAASGDTIQVDPGTYTEQVTINKSLTLQGTAGTIIQGPNPTIDAGILVVGGATADVTGSTIANINRGQAGFGVQTGNGIQVGGTASQAVGQVGHATITDCTITDYQKRGIAAGTAGTTVTITGSTVTGVGPTMLNGQNGIVIFPMATATITGNTISGNQFTGTNSGPDPFTNTQAAGILDLGGGPDTITGNMVVNNDIGINTTGTGTTISGNTVQGSFEGLLLGAGTATVSNNTITGNNIGVTVIAFAGDTTNAVGALVSNNITNNGNGGPAFPGGGIVLQNEAGATMTALLTAAHFNRIVGNSVGLNNTPAATVDTTDNWWGSNAGPDGAGSDTLHGNGGDDIVIGIPPTTTRTSMR